MMMHTRESVSCSSPLSCTFCTLAFHGPWIHFELFTLLKLLVPFRNVMSIDATPLSKFLFQLYNLYMETLYFHFASPAILSILKQALCCTKLVFIFSLYLINISLGNGDIPETSIQMIECVTSLGTFLPTSKSVFHMISLLFLRKDRQWDQRQASTTTSRCIWTTALASTTDGSAYLTVQVSPLLIILCTCKCSSARYLQVYIYTQFPHLASLVS